MSRAAAADFKRLMFHNRYLLLDKRCFVAQRGESTGLLQKIDRRAIGDLAGIPNYVCVDSIERSLWIPAERQFRRLDRVHVEVAHIEGADRVGWLDNSIFESSSTAEMAGYGASFDGDFADTRALVFRKVSIIGTGWTRIQYSGRVSINWRPALRYDYDSVRPVLKVTNGSQSGYTPARGSFWIGRRARWLPARR